MAEQNSRKTDKPVKHVIKNFMEVIDKMCKQSNDQDMILSELKLVTEKGEECYTCDSEVIKGAILLLEHSDEIWKRIRKNYIRKILDVGQYDLEDCGEDIVDIHTIMRVINKDKEPVAWICVETNLYIVTKKKAGEKCAEAWKQYSGNDELQWRYLSVSTPKEEPIKLNTPTKLDYNISIDLNKILGPVL